MEKMALGKLNISLYPNTMRLTSCVVALAGSLALISSVAVPYCAYANTSLPQFTIANSPSPSIAISDLFDKANTAQQQGRYHRAEQYWRQIIEEFPSSAGARVGLGHALKAQSYVSDAEKYYREAIKIDPNYALSYESLADVLVDQDRESDALEVYRKAIQLNPKRVYALVGMGNAFYHLNKVDEAIQVYQQAIKLRPDYAYVYVSLGNALKYQGKLDEAIRAYQRAIEINPQDTYAFTKLGQVLSEQEQLSTALVAYSQAAQTSSTCNTELFYALGDTYLKQARFQEAQQAYDKAGQCGISILDKRFLSVGLILTALRDSIIGIRTESDGKTVKKYVCDLRNVGDIDDFNKCLGDSSKDDDQSVFRELTNSIFLSPNLLLSPGTQGVESFFNLNALNLEKFRLKASQQPDSADANASFGIVLVLGGKSNEAIQYLEKALIIDPKVESVEYLATFLIASGKRKIVLDVLDRAISKNPDAALVYFSVANHLNSLNRSKEVQLILDHAYAKYPNNPILLSVQISTLIFRRDHSGAQKAINRLQLTKGESSLEDLSKYANYLNLINQKLSNVPKDQGLIPEVIRLIREQKNQPSFTEQNDGLIEKGLDVLQKLAVSPNGLNAEQTYQRLFAFLEQQPMFASLLHEDPQIAARLKALLLPILSSDCSVEPQLLQEILTNDPQNLSATLLKACGEFNRQKPRDAAETLKPTLQWKNAQRSGLSEVLANGLRAALNQSDQGIKYAPFQEQGIKKAGIRRSIVAILPASETWSDRDIAKSAKCGTGVVIGRQSNAIYILTARHVLTNQNSSCKAASEYKVEFYSQPLAEQQRLRLYADVIPETLQISRFPDDLAILRVVGGVPRDVQSLELATSTPRKGDSLSLIGHPGNEEWVTTSVIVQDASQAALSDLRVRLPKYPELQDVPGYSGGAIFDGQRRLVGLFTNTNSGGSAYSFQAINNLIRELNKLP